MASLHNTSKNVNHTLYQLLEGQKIAEARILVESMVDTVPSNDKEYRGFISLVIKFYIIVEDSHSLDNIYSKNNCAVYIKKLFSQLKDVNRPKKPML